MQKVKGRYMKMALASAGAMAAMFPRLARAAAPAYVFQYSSGTYNENFNSLPYNTSNADVSPSATPTINSTQYTLPSAGTAFDLSNTIPGGSALTGWYGIRPQGNVYGADGGDASTGGIYSFGGSTAPTNRALGLIGTSSTSSTEVGVLLYNTTSTTYNQFSLNYNAELWRQQMTAKTLNFGYAVQSASSVTGLPSVSTAVTALSSGAFTTGTSSGSTNSTAPIQTNPISATNVSLSTSWAPNTYLWLTWSTSSEASSGQGVAIDDVNFTPGVASVPLDVWNNGTSWDTNNINWLQDASPSKFSNGDGVQFSDTNVGAVTIQVAGVQPASVTVSNSAGTYQFLNAANATAGIGGTGALTMSGSGTLDLSGLTVANTYSGGTNLNGGTIVVSNDNQLGNPSASLTFNGGALKDIAGIMSSRAIKMVGAGTFDTGANTSTLNGNFDAETGAFTKVGSGTLILGGTTPAGSVTVAAGTLQFNESGTQALNADPAAMHSVDGTIALTNTGAGTGQRLNVTGTLAGTGSIYSNASAGTVALASTSTGTISVPVVLGNTLTSSTFAKGDVGASTYVDGTVVADIGATSGNTLTVNGALSGYSDVDIAAGNNGGSGTLILNGQNTYAGTTSINAGNAKIVLGVANALPTGTDLIEGTQSGFGAPTLDLNGNNQQLASLSDGTAVTGSKFLTITNSGSLATLDINGSVTPAKSFGGVIAGNISLTKDGSNMLKLGGVNTYTGTTTINSGILQVTSGASLANTSGVTVNGGAFGGNGTVAGPVNVAGGSIFAGATGTGSLTVQHNVTMQSGSTLTIKIAQPANASGGTGSGAEGTDNDTVMLTGSGVFDATGGATLQVMPILSTFSNGTSGFNYTYTIVDTAAGVATGSYFANLGGTNNTVYNDGNLAYTVNYGADSITLDVTSVPEPGCVGMMGLGSLALLRRGRRAGRALASGR